MELETKTAHPMDVKFDDEKGTVRAVFATLNVKDSDGDVTRPGFFGKQRVAIAESHDRSKLAGKGHIFESGDDVILEGKYFLETIQGRESYLTAKAMGDLQEWSYGFYIEEGGAKRGTHEGEAVRILQPKDDGTPGAKVAEVSTVLVGAGVGTHTTSIKSHDGQRFVEQAEQVAKAVEMLVVRSNEIQQMRSEKGGQMGAEAVAKLLDVKTRIEAALSMLGDLTIPDENTTPDYESLLLGVPSALAESDRLLGR